MKLGEYELDKIYNEDCYEAIKKIPDKSVDCIYTDIPYFYNNGYHKNENNIGCNFADTQIKIAKFIDDINYNLIDDFFRISKKINMFIWCSESQIYSMMKKIYKYPKSKIKILIWNKTNTMAMNLKQMKTDLEYCLYVTEGQGINNIGIAISKLYQSPSNGKDKLLFEHPTIKPLELVERHILISTQKNDIIFDPFMGSGTTAVACKELNRYFIGFEIDKLYYKIANDRLNGITKEDREKKEKGQLSLF